jgi:hypothetical protein
MNSSTLSKLTEIREALEADLLGEEEKMVFGKKRRITNPTGQRLGTSRSGARAAQKKRAKAPKEKRAAKFKARLMKRRSLRPAGSI